MDNMNIDEIINYVSTNCGSSLRQTYQIKWNWTFQRKCYHLFTFLDNLMHFLAMIWRRRASAQKETQSCAKQNIFTRTKD